MLVTKLTSVALTRFITGTLFSSNQGGAVPQFQCLYTYLVQDCSSWYYLYSLVAISFLSRPDAYNVKELSLPAFPLDVVREVVIEALDMAAEVNQLHNRDPIGGSNEDLFVPLIKILDKLLLCGALANEDIEHLLVLIHPATWDRCVGN